MDREPGGGSQPDLHNVDSRVKNLHPPVDDVMLRILARLDLAVTGRIVSAHPRTVGRRSTRKATIRLIQLIRSYPKGEPLLDGRTVLDGSPVSEIGKSEKVTQSRVIALFLDELGYRILGDWPDRENRQIDEGLLRDWLVNREHSAEQIGRTLDLLGREANNRHGRAAGPP